MDKAWDESQFHVLLATLEAINSNNGCLFVCFAAWENLPVILKAIERSAWMEPRVITWWKVNTKGHGKRYLDATEYLVLAWRKGKSEGYWNFPSSGEGTMLMRQNVWAFPNVANGVWIYPEDGRPINPCQKPQDLLRSLISHHVPPGGLVLDLCAGSHSLMMACISEGVSCISLESDRRQHLAALQVIQSKIDLLASKQENYLVRLSAAKKANDDEPEDDVLPAWIPRLRTVEGRRRYETVLVLPDPFGDACRKCAGKQGPNPTICHACKAHLHPECMWHHFLFAVGDRKKEMVYVCKRECWLGLEQDPDFVPVGPPAAAPPPPPAETSVASASPPPASPPPASPPPDTD